ncbi:hypothetical protein K457DRAFT_756615 [Linnemannia elongata AG-77]|uniref:Crinkler effector protein N-terminal domain-containing protein n=1 Tax=Linnemannia elongata AG-77 TaxID=1314771 RepID=A0A197JLT5_9FUNG|nr:hypothetical protein K457DRAFT_756615 [Linnemannia elongata AG-77]
MLRNTMTDNHLNLFCLVDGEGTSNAFSVKIASTDTVDDLKVHIKNKKPVDFEHVDANNLTLWHVSHPVIAANKHQPVLLNAIDSPIELDPTDEVNDVFSETPPKKTIHIIVQRPPIVLTLFPARVSTPHLAHAWDRSRSVTPIQLTSVPKDHIEKELVVVLESVSHRHTTDPVDEDSAIS